MSRRNPRREVSTKPGVFDIDDEDDDMGGPFQYDDYGGADMQRAIELSKQEFKQHNSQEDDDTETAIRISTAGRHTQAAESRRRVTASAVSTVSSGWKSKASPVVVADEERCKKRPPIGIARPLSTAATGSKLPSAPRTASATSIAAATASALTDDSDDIVECRTVFPAPEAKSVKRNSDTPCSPAKRRPLRRPNISSNPTKSAPTSAKPAEAVCLVSPQRSAPVAEEAGNQATATRSESPQLTRHRQQQQQQVDVPKMFSDDDRGEKMTRPALRPSSSGSAATHVDSTGHGRASTANGEQKTSHKATTPQKPKKTTPGRPEVLRRTKRSQAGPTHPKEILVQCYERGRLGEAPFVKMRPCPLKYLPDTPPCSPNFKRIKTKGWYQHGAVPGDIPSCILTSVTRGYLFCPRPDPDVCDTHCDKLGLCASSSPEQRQKRQRITAQLLIRLHEWQRCHVQHAQSHLKEYMAGDVPGFQAPCTEPEDVASPSTRATTDQPTRTSRRLSPERSVEAWRDILPPTGLTTPKTTTASTRKPRIALTRKAVPASRPSEKQTIADALRNTGKHMLTDPSKDWPLDDEEEIYRTIVDAARGKKEDCSREETTYGRDRTDAHDLDADVVDLSERSPPKQQKRSRAEMVDTEERYHSSTVRGSLDRERVRDGGSDPKRPCKQPMDRTEAERIAMVAAGGGGSGAAASSTFFSTPRSGRSRSRAPATSASSGASDLTKPHADIFTNESETTDGGQPESPDIGSMSDRTPYAESEEYPPQAPEAMQECPICQAMVPASRIEQHADRCTDQLERQQREEEEQEHDHVLQQYRNTNTNTNTKRQETARRHNQQTSIYNFDGDDGGAFEHPRLTADGGSRRRPFSSKRASHS